MPQIAGFRGVLGSTRDASRAVYRYHQIFAGPGRSLTRKSVICAVQLTPYTDNLIRPHEHASAAVRDAALEKIRATHTHVDPVLMGFRDPATEVERLCRKAEAAAPIID